MTGVRPQDRLAWHRQLTHDRGLSHVAIHVGLAISNHFNNGSGETFIGMEKLAAEAGVYGRTAERAVSTLAKRGHLRVKRGGGRGLANTYAMVIRESCPPPQNPGAGDAPTLKENSKKENDGFSIKEKSKPAAAEDIPDFRLGDNGDAVLRIGSPQWQAWLDYYQAAGDTKRASVMRFQVENSRTRQWQEPTEWPPSQVEQREHDSRTASGRR